MKEKLKRSAAYLTACLPALIYITWLSAYYWLLEGGRYRAFFQPKLWPLLILTLLLLLAYSTAFISQFTGHPTRAIKADVWLNAAILILPALFLWSIYGHSLGADAFAKRAFNTTQNLSAEGVYLRKSPGRGVSGSAPTLLDLITNGEKFEGRQVAVEGMVYRSAGSDSDGFALFRFAVVCCAADALPFSIRVETKSRQDLQNDTWVRVEGLFSTATINGKRVSVINAVRVQLLPTPPPEKRYLFF
jgi:uncharacterized repeat protein (TIGR03943 family)